MLVAARVRIGPRDRARIIHSERDRLSGLRRIQLRVDTSTQNEPMLHTAGVRVDPHHLVGRIDPRSLRKGGSWKIDLLASWAVLLLGWIAPIVYSVRLLNRVNKKGTGTTDGLG